MSFSDDVARFAKKVERRAQDIHNGVCDLAFQSIVEGSPVTGAPGQPVDTGNLRDSWQSTEIGPLARDIVTNVSYAPIIEDGTRKGKAMTVRSPVGGFHSVKLTVAGWARIVEAVTRRVTGPRGA